MKGKVVAVCEDHDFLRSELAKRFCQLGAEAIECANSEELLRLCASDQKIDLITLDLRLPGQSGEDVARQINLERVLPIVVISEKDPDDILRGCRDNPCIYNALTKAASNDIRQLHLTAVFSMQRFANWDRYRREIDDLRQKLEDRKLLDRAKGIIMRQNNISEAEAHRLLQDQASKRRRKMTDVCRSIIEADEVIGGVEPS